MKLLVGLSLLSAILFASPGRCHTVALHGIAFSDEKGGFVLERVTGKGSITEGDVPAGSAVTVRFVVSQPSSLREAFIAQRPGRPLADDGTSRRQHLRGRLLASE